MSNIMRLIFILFMTSIIAGAQEVTVKLSSQPEWPPGKPVIVNVDIIKDDVEGFARFFQDLPQGFIVECIEKAGADFYWENNQVNFVWVEIPEQDVLSLQYLVQADISLSGSFKLAGRFDYIINNNERKSSEANPLFVKLKKNATVDNSYAIINDDKQGLQDTMEVKNPEPEVKPVDTKVSFRIQVALASESLTITELQERLGCELEGKFTVLKTGRMLLS